MGFYVRKSISVGLMRFNLTGGGIGVSFGIPGLRLGFSPRGNYIHMGRNGVYYRHALGPGRQASRAAPAMPPPAPAAGESAPPAASDTIAVTAITSGDVTDMVHSDSADLLAEMQRKARAPNFARIGAIVGAVFIIAATIVASSILSAVCAIVGLASAIGGYILSVRNRTTILMYDLEDPLRERYAALVAAFDTVKTCHKLWHVTGSGKITDSKYHGGAGTAIKRNNVVIGVGAPPRIRSNLSIPWLPAGDETLYFLPDRILVYARGNVGAVGYEDLQAQLQETRMIENGSVPGDAAVIDHTWQYVNRKGGPDARFKDNKKLPVCAYPELHFTSASGLNELFTCSRRDGFSGLPDALANMRSNDRA